VLVTVERVEGVCPLMLLEGDETLYQAFSATSLDHVCPFAQNAIYQYISGMTEGISAFDLGIACEDKSGDGFACCGAWGCPTVEAKVVFRLRPIPSDVPVIDFGYTYMSRGDHHSTPEDYREKYTSEEVRQQREDLIKEYDEAGRPLFWDKWAIESKLKQRQLKARQEGIPRWELSEEVLKGTEIWERAMGAIDPHQDE